MIMRITNSMIKDYLKLKKQARKIEDKLAPIRNAIEQKGSFKTRYYEINVSQYDRVYIKNVTALIKKFGKRKLKGFYTNSVRNVINIQEKQRFKMKIWIANVDTTCGQFFIASKSESKLTKELAEYCIDLANDYEIDLAACKTDQDIINCYFDEMIDDFYRIEQVNLID